MRSLPAGSSHQYWTSPSATYFPVAGAVPNSSNDSNSATAHDTHSMAIPRSTGDASDGNDSISGTVGSSMQQIASSFFTIGQIGLECLDEESDDVPNTNSNTHHHNSSSNTAAAGGDHEHAMWGSTSAHYGDNEHYQQQQQQQQLSFLQQSTSGSSGNNSSSAALLQQALPGTAAHRLATATANTPAAAVAAIVAAPTAPSITAVATAAAAAACAYNASAAAAALPEQELHCSDISEVWRVLSESCATGAYDRTLTPTAAAAAATASTPKWRQRFATGSSGSSAVAQTAAAAAAAAAPAVTREQLLPWKRRAFGGKLTQRILSHYVATGDVQMCATMVCVFRSAEAPGDHAAATSSTVENGCEPLLSPPEADAQQHTRCLEAYGNLLYTWGSHEQRLEVLKHKIVAPRDVAATSVPHQSSAATWRGSSNSAAAASAVKAAQAQQQAQSEQDVLAGCEQLQLSSECTRCGTQVQAESACTKCGGFGFQCSVCQLTVRGASFFCSSCGHGGHSQHIAQWFASGQKLCPTGCGCACLEREQQSLTTVS
jgi:Zinc-ribbon, C4HC2 type